MPILKKSVRRPWMPEYQVQGRRLQPNTKFYQSTAWRNLRKVKLEQDPLCEECLKKGFQTPAQVADHIVASNQGCEMLDIHNLQSLCHPCHNKKSGIEAHKREQPNPERLLNKTTQWAHGQSGMHAKVMKPVRPFIKITA